MCHFPREIINFLNTPKHFLVIASSVLLMDYLAETNFLYAVDAANIWD